MRPDVPKYIQGQNVTVIYNGREIPGRVLEDKGEDTYKVQIEGGTVTVSQDYL